MLNLSPPPCGLAGSSGAQGPCFALLHGLQQLDVYMGSLSSASVVKGLIGGCAVMVAVLFTLFAIQVVTSFFERRAQQSAFGFLAGTDRASASWSSSPSCVDRANAAQCGVDDSRECDVEDDTEDDTPDEEAEE